MRAYPPIPTRIAGIDVPQDDVSVATWRWVHRALPDFLLTHSIRAYFWGAAIAAGEARTFDRRILWNASLLHDYGLTRIPRNTMCFEVEGAEIARELLIRFGLDDDAAERAAIAIILHMQPGVTQSDGIEAVLLDRATGLDVRGDGFALVDAVRPAVMERYPRRQFDRWFLAAIHARRRSGRAARARGCSTRPGSPTGWRARRGPTPRRSARDRGARPGHALPADRAVRDRAARRR